MSLASLKTVTGSASSVPQATPPTSALGRPPATTHAAIERAAFALFEQQGFEATRLDDIAVAAGVGRRTLFRYYPSKNDIPWGQFDDNLRRLEGFLEALPRNVPILEAIRCAVLDFNTVDPEAVAQHRERMRLILSTPALIGHSELRYTAWRDVISAYVAERTGLEPSDLLPATVGRVSLALSLSAYERWLLDDDASFADLLNASFQALRSLLEW